MTKTELQQHLEQVRAQAKASVKEKVEIARMQAQLSLLESESFLDAQAKAELRKQTTDKLTHFNTLCSTIVSDNPIQNVRARTTRTWNPSKQYGLGNHIAELTGLLSGIQYSVAEHSESMYAAIPLNSDLVESTLNAFGSLPYYSANYDMVIDGTPANLDEILANVALIEAQLGICIDKSHLTQANLDRRYASALARANAEQAEAQLTSDTQHFVIT